MFKGNGLKRRDGIRGLIPKKFYVTKQMSARLKKRKDRDGNPASQSLIVDRALREYFGIKQL